MLYTSTRNINEIFTAYRALNEATTPDGGMYVPYRTPVLHTDELAALRKQSAAKTIADILNLFFGAHISDTDVEEAVGKFSFQFHEVNSTVLFAEMWHNLGNNSEYLIKSLYKMMTGKNELPNGWAYIAIEIALLFGIYGAIDKKYRELDIAVPADDFRELTAALYAKDMGLPLKRIVGTCGENGIAWDLVNKGEFSTNQVPPYLEVFLHKYVCDQGIKNYMDACARKGVYYLEDVHIEQISSVLYIAVVSSGRIDTVISSMYSSAGYHIDCGTAFTYGGLQDYRASVGANERTVILSRKRPERIKE